MLFISKYPKSDYLKEGMFQRIKNIDNIFGEYDKKYLEVSYLRNINKRHVIIGNTEIISLNYFIHRRQINKILKYSKKIYIHSLYNFIKLYGFKKYENNIYILDFHGAVPEEMHFSGKKLKSKIFKYFESTLCKKLDVGIYVTKAMQNFYKSRYNIKNNICYPIYSNNVLGEAEKDKIINLKNKLKINNDDIVIVYSGNTQSWQNIDMMIEQIKEIEKNPKYKIIIMTGERELMNKKILENNLKKVTVVSVLPNELKYYYSIANYGYILRDESILNKLACPTKLIEYMYYGIIPIVLFEDIGDFIEKGYEYVKFYDINKGISLKAKKSLKNMNIINEMISNSNQNNLIKIIK